MKVWKSLIKWYYGKIEPDESLVLLREIAEDIHRIQRTTCPQSQLGGDGHLPSFVDSRQMLRRHFY